MRTEFTVTQKHSKKKDLSLFLSCEHASNKIPAAYQKRIPEKILKTHHAYDLGALQMVRLLSRTLKTPAYTGVVSRLVIDLNRSLHNRKTLFSRFLSNLNETERQTILKQFYHPYRNRIETAVTARIQDNHCVLHLSIHSFTPILRGHKRNADIGLLFDPAHRQEAVFCRRLRKNLAALAPGFKIRMNYPYLGISDAFTTQLRKQHPSKHYLGIEIEMNQRIFIEGGKKLQLLRKTLPEAIRLSLK
ncbi:MAG: N-formylglutamate amidohydrolase [Candidatus Omnitrophica bacterium]|nr:N-formylglutamate amidohydrolase [Candidatus Omnitrophota bacterium]